MAQVLVTGGTGFVGSHTVAALVSAGHRVRVLVRDQNRLGSAFDPLNVSVDDVVVGDVLEPASIRAAVEGCDALIHAANVYSFHPRSRDAMSSVNVEGTRSVLELGAEAGLSPLIHVSSTLALLPSSEPLTESSPIGQPAPAYSRSKAEAERVARHLASEGAPIVITNPASVWGPHDPNVGESTRLAIAVLKGQMRAVNDGTMFVVDVRDVAAAHAALIDSTWAGRRFILCAHNLPFHDLLIRIGELTGRSRTPVKVPAGMAMALGRGMDWISRLTGAALPIGFEPPWILANSAPADTTSAAESLGITWRPLDETLTDTVQWLTTAGLVDRRRAGSLAPT